MEDTGELCGIGAFARRVGLAPSALRFYDDCGVLRPARVDAVTGYRYYAAAQEPRAVRLRRLRAAGLPLVDVSVVLDGSAAEAREVLHRHLERTRRSADEAQAVIEAFLGEATDGAPDAGGRVRARVGGAELASAVRQVAPAAAVGAARERFPLLGGVLLELAEGEVRWVATDRYRLAVRVLRPTIFEGGTCRVLIGADEARAVAAWAVRQVDVDIVWDGSGIRLRSGTGPREASAGAWGGRAEGPETAPGGAEGTNAGAGGADGPSPEAGGAEGPTIAVGSAEGYPDHRLVWEGLAAGRSRLIVDRGALRDAVAGRSGAVSLTGDEDEDSGAGGDAARDGDRAGGARAAERGDGQALVVAGGGREPVLLRAVRTGPRLRIAFDPAVLVPALEAGVGPDVLLEIASASLPVVVRSADQGSFTTLVMPVRDAADDAADDADVSDR